MSYPKLEWEGITLDDTPTLLTVTGPSSGVWLNVNETSAFELVVVCHEAGDMTNRAGWKFEGLLWRGDLSGPASNMDATITSSIIGTPHGTMTVSIGPDTSNNSMMLITVTGEAAAEVHWTGAVTLRSVL